MRERVVVDTNVLIVANGRDKTPADRACEISCIEAIEKAIAKQIVLLDQSGLIMEEYELYCSHAGQPGVGDVFFKFLHDREHSDMNVRRVSVKKTPDEEGGFANLPPNDLDVNDRKFLAVAKASNGCVLNATDSDWREHAKFITSLGVPVRELCPHCLKGAEA